MGIMRKAGRLEVGELSTGDTVKAGRAKLLLLASDASDNARKRAERFLTGHRALLVPLPYTKDELGELLGKGGCSMAAATDAGLSAAFMDALGEYDPERYGEQAREMRRRCDKYARRKSGKPTGNAGRKCHE